MLTVDLNRVKEQSSTQMQYNWVLPLFPYFTEVYAGLGPEGLFGRWVQEAGWEES
jgi:hypothetical protein